MSDPRSEQGPPYERADALRLLSHETLVRLASDLMAKVLDAHAETCRYCGIRPSEDFPRPSYQEMKQALSIAHTHALQRGYGPEDGNDCALVAEVLDAVHPGREAR